jgi:hypothetical protein
VAAGVAQQRGELGDSQLCGGAGWGWRLAGHVLAALVGADETDPGTMDWSAEATIPVWSKEEGKSSGAGSAWRRKARQGPRPGELSACLPVSLIGSP